MPVTKETQADRVLEVLEEADGPLTRGELLDRVDFSASRLDNLLGTMVDRGEITRPGHGTYALPDAKDDSHIPATLHGSPVQKKVYKLMQQESGEVNRTNLAERLGKSPRSIDQALKGLESKDLVQKTSRGWYRSVSPVGNSDENNLHSSNEGQSAIIPLLSVAAEAGDSSFAWETRIRDYMRVNRSIISTETGADPDDLAVVPISGDSMEPKISAGDRVVIVRHDGGTIIEGCVYLWRSSRRGLMLKRAHWCDDDILELISDNEKYDPIKLDWNGSQESWQCIGQVVRKLSAV